MVSDISLYKNKADDWDRSVMWGDFKHVVLDIHACNLQYEVHTDTFDPSILKILPTALCLKTEIIVDLPVLYVDNLQCAI